MNSDRHLASFVVFCSDDDGMDNKLKNLGAKEKLKNTILTLHQPSGPHGYRIAADADVTVVLYTKKVVKVNKAFRKGELKEANIEKVLFEVDKVLPEKKGEAMDLAVYAPTDLKWTDAPAILPRGAKIAMLEGDPTKEGPFVMRVRLPDGYKIPPHTPQARALDRHLRNVLHRHGRQVRCQQGPGDARRGVWHLARGDEALRLGEGGDDHPVAWYRAVDVDVRPPRRRSAQRAQVGEARLSATTAPSRSRF
jgi:hypothetical protein